ncbi:hypothetical protein FRC02_011333 [Tulasnella sp. 418]|nr:hypothetical protein FRC02_011333 [Tulasnella sp. 418]
MITLLSNVADEALDLLVKAIEEFQVVETIPGMDPLSRDKLDNSVARIELAAQALQAHAKKRILAIKRNQNLLALIYKLPVELLEGIILRVAQESRPEYCYKVNLCLASVSSQWYATCISSQRLWAYVGDYMRSETLNIHLERCTRSRLHIPIGQYSEPVEKSQERFLDAVTPHANRWKSLSIGIKYCGELSPTYLNNQHFLQLEELLYLAVPLSINPSPLLQNLSAPSLYLLNFSIQPFPLRLEPDLLSNLRTFHSRLTSMVLPSVPKIIPPSSHPHLISTPSKSSGMDIPLRAHCILMPVLMWNYST